MYQPWPSCWRRARPATCRVSSEGTRKLRRSQRFWGYPWSASTLLRWNPNREIRRENATEILGKCRENARKRVFAGNGSRNRELAGASGIWSRWTVGFVIYWSSSWGLWTDLYITRSTAFRRPWGFCDQRGVMDHVWCARANRFLMWFLRPLTPYSGAVFQKHAFCLDETSIFVFFAEAETNSPWHAFSRLLVRAALLVPRTFEDLDFLTYNASMNTYCVTEGCKVQENLQWRGMTYKCKVLENLQ